MRIRSLYSSMNLCACSDGNDSNMMAERSQKLERDQECEPSTSKRTKLENDDCDSSKTYATFNVTPQEPIIASELDERIFTYVSDSNSFNFVNFGILKLGPLCNASESFSFTEANCHVKTVKNENNLALILEFNQLFSRGVTLLSDVKNDRRVLDQHEVAAIRILDRYFKEKGKSLIVHI